MKTMTKAIALALLSAGIAPMSAGAQGAPAQMDDPKAVYKVPVDGSPVRGPADAIVTVVEVSDFECPFCKRGGATLKELESAYPGKLRVVFKHNPLSMHPNAVPAALMAEAARADGGDTRFWAMHDRLYEMQALDPASLDAAARDLGVQATVAKVMLDGAKLERIRRDQTLARSLGANGTPTFFVNGRKVVGALPLESFRAIVDEEIAKAEALVKSGTPRADLYAAIVAKGATAPVMVAGTAPATPAPAPPAAAAKVPLRKDDPAKGPKAALVSVVIFSDFQCPFCTRVEPTLQQIEKAYAGKARIVWKHQPLGFHPSALPAAKASEAARAQGKFWEMHDKLFANQSSLSEATYERLAAELNLDVARFRKDTASGAAAGRIAADQKLAESAGATGTPTLFVNCRKVVGAQPFEAFQAIIDEEIKKGEARIAKGEKLDAGFYDRICAANVVAAPAAVAARTNVVVPVRPDDPAQGPRSAKVTVIEFSDFQCPYCSRAVSAVAELEKKHAKDVRVVWKHMPLSFHPNAMPAALAAEAAREQGKFWEMHDRLFANQSTLSDATYERLARELNLDLARFQAARSAPATQKRVTEDMAAAAAAGVNGTPTFVVNGELVVGTEGLAAAVGRRLGKGPVAAR